MLEKFLISIGLKQPESVEEVMSTQQTTVRPSGENRFIDDENIGDIRVHSPKDIRDIPDQQERRRILDFVTGMAFMSNSTIRSINRDGVFLILPSNSSLSSTERERLQDLGLYKINV